MFYNQVILWYPVVGGVFRAALSCSTWIHLWVAANYPVAPTPWVVKPWAQNLDRVMGGVSPPWPILSSSFPAIRYPLRMSVRIAPLATAFTKVLSTLDIAFLTGVPARRTKYVAAYAADLMVCPYLFVALYAKMVCHFPLSFHFPYDAFGFPSGLIVAGSSSIQTSTCFPSLSINSCLAL